jgi:hypothetical protein
MPERETKSSDKFSFDALRRVNQQNKREVQPPQRPYDYYEAHPEHRHRPLTRRQMRRRAIRGG